LRKPGSDTAIPLTARPEYCLSTGECLSAYTSCRELAVAVNKSRERRTHGTALGMSIRFHKAKYLVKKIKQFVEVNKFECI
jgi:hypothetical protein